MPYKSEEKTSNYSAACSKNCYLTAQMEWSMVFVIH